MDEQDVYFEGSSCEEEELDYEEGNSSGGEGEEEEYCYEDDYDIEEYFDADSQRGFQGNSENGDYEIYHEGDDG